MTSDNKSIMTDYAQTLHLQVRNLWPTNYPENLSNVLKVHNVSTILDCAGGTGFPSLELKEMGWDISYSDGSEEMFNFFNELIATKNLKIPSYLSLWQQLDTNVPNTYDAVLCRGNSLIGVSAYNGEERLSYEETLNLIQESIDKMFNKVNQGGLLYIDTPKPEHAKPKEPYTITTTTEIETTISYDPRTKLRTTRDIRTEQNGEQTTTYHLGYPIDSEVLLDMLHTAGFKKVELSPIEEAGYINAYIAFK